MTDLFFKPFGTHQFLYPYPCKRGIPYNQALRFNRICPVSESFDQPTQRFKKMVNGKEI